MMNLNQYLHSESLQLGIPPNGLNVPDGQANQQVHQQNGHKNHEDGQNCKGGEGIWQSSSVAAKIPWIRTASRLNRFIVCRRRECGHHGSGVRVFTFPATIVRVDEGVDVIQVPEHH